MFIGPLISAGLGAAKLPLLCGALIAIASFGFMMVGMIKNSASSEFIIDLQSQALKEQQQARDHIREVDDVIAQQKQTLDERDFDLDDFNRVLNNIPERGKEDKCHIDSVLVLPLP